MPFFTPPYVKAQLEGLLSKHTQVASMRFGSAVPEAVMIGYFCYLLLLSLCLHNT